MKTETNESGAGKKALRHLFLNPEFLEGSEDTELKVNPPTRREVVLRPDASWEPGMIGLFLSVFEDEGRLRMWYFTNYDEKDISCQAYAESVDGIHWSKPILNLVECQGTKQNNLMNLPTHEGAVFEDTKGTAEAKYLCVANVFGEGLVLFFSQDGLSWQRDKEPLLKYRCDTQNQVLWDDAIQSYVVYLRGWDVSPGWKQRLRRTVRFVTDDLRQPFHIVPSGLGKNPLRDNDLPRLTEKEMPVVFAADEKDPANSDFYNMSAIKYPLDERWYMGFPSLMDHRGESISHGLLDVHFIGGNDGISWNRYDRTPYIPLGPDGSQTGGMLYMGTGMVVRGDEIWQYATAYKTNHGDPITRRKTGDGVIYRYVQRVDGFVSVDFPTAGGHCLTAPVKVDDNHLFVNLKPTQTGQLKVGLFGSDGNPVPGFEADSCSILSEDSTHAKVSWNDRRDVSSLQGRDIKVGFWGRDVKLYSFYFDTGN